MADTLDSIAFTYSQSGDYARAIDHFEQALAVYRQIGDTEGEALSRLNLGDAQLAYGLPDAARRSWERALGAAGRDPRRGRERGQRPARPADRRVRRSGGSPSSARPSGTSTMR